MKGIVFSEFIQMVEDRFSIEVADKIISASSLETGGAYTAVGTYDHREMVELVSRLSSETSTPVPALLRAFGEHLFGRFAQLYPVHFTGLRSAFEFLSTLDSKIHQEVQKLYPDAELPQFDCECPEPDVMVMTYRSKRPFADLAEGLLWGCIRHFGEDIALTRETLPCTDGAHERFTLKRPVSSGRH